ncbi:MAG: hypothetical protein HYY17_10990 [Planctomycetes bacterium]|nr:hypothetical protein [Planctomycetota bacterium]
MADDASTLDRRSFLATVLRAAGVLAPASLLLSGRLPWLDGDETRLDAARVPVWHPECTGTNDLRCVTVSRDRAGGSRSEIRLEGAAARLWCLCGGRYSETELAARVAEGEPWVAPFLFALYALGYLVRLNAEDRVGLWSREVEIA